MQRSELQEQLQYLLQLDEEFAFAAVSRDVLQVMAELCRRRQERKAVVPPVRRTSAKSSVISPHVAALVQACEASRDAVAIETLREYCRGHVSTGENGAGVSLVYTALAEFLLKRRESDNEISEALSLLDDAVAAQHPGAMLQVGLCLRDGVGVPRDLTAALFWVERAADVNYAPAMFELGAMYDDGVRCPDGDECLHADWGEAAEWYRGAAERGHTMAQLNLGKLFWRAAAAAREVAPAGLENNAIEELQSKSRTWLESAASAGNEEAVRLLCRR